MKLVGWRFIFLHQHTQTSITTEYYFLLQWESLTPNFENLHLISLEILDQQQALADTPLEKICISTTWCELFEHLLVVCASLQRSSLLALVNFRLISFPSLFPSILTTNFINIDNIRPPWVNHRLRHPMPSSTSLMEHSCESRPGERGLSPLNLDAAHTDS